MTGSRCRRCNRGGEPRLCAASQAERVAALPRIPRDAGGPVFAEPWKAQAFALAVRLSEERHFTWNEWPTPRGLLLSLSCHGSGGVLAGG
jgi:hypothetical protein